MATAMDMGNDLSHLKENFNQHAIGNAFGHVAKHVLIMGAMMGVIALASPVAAAAVAIPGTDPYTLGNLVVQTGHGSWEMLKMIGDTLSSLISIGGDLISNTFDGNIMPTSWDSMIMSHDIGNAIDHSTHLTSIAGSETVMHTLTPMEWFETLPITEQLQMREDASLFGIPFDEYVADWCATAHPEL